MTSSSAWSGDLAAQLLATRDDDDDDDAGAEWLDVSLWRLAAAASTEDNDLGLDLDRVTWHASRSSPTGQHHRAWALDNLYSRVDTKTHLLSTIKAETLNVLRRRQRNARLEPCMNNKTWHEKQRQDSASVKTKNFTERHHYRVSTSCGSWPWQELSWCWDGHAMWRVPVYVIHVILCCTVSKLSRSIRQTVPLFNALCLSNISVHHTLPTTSFFALQTDGSHFNHFHVTGPRSAELGEITQNNGHYAVQGHPRSSLSVSLESAYATSY